MIFYSLLSCDAGLGVYASLAGENGTLNHVRHVHYGAS